MLQSCVSVGVQLALGYASARGSVCPALMCSGNCHLQQPLLALGRWCAWATQAYPLSCWVHECPSDRPALHPSSDQCEPPPGLRASGQRGYLPDCDGQGCGQPASQQHRPRHHRGLCKYNPTVVSLKLLRSSAVNPPITQQGYPRPWMCTCELQLHVAHICIVYVTRAS